MHWIYGKRRNRDIDLQRQTDFCKVKVWLKLFVDTFGLLRLKVRFENAALDHYEKH